jgi:hypothetical protein
MRRGHHALLWSRSWRKAHIGLRANANTARDGDGENGGDLGSPLSFFCRPLESASTY